MQVLTLDKVNAIKQEKLNKYSYLLWKIIYLLLGQVHEKYMNLQDYQFERNSVSVILTTQFCRSVSQFKRKRFQWTLENVDEHQVGKGYKKISLEIGLHKLLTACVQTEHSTLQQWLTNTHCKALHSSIRTSSHLWNMVVVVAWFGSALLPLDRTVSLQRQTMKSELYKQIQQKKVKVSKMGGRPWTETQHSG